MSKAKSFSTKRYNKLPGDFSLKGIHTYPTAFFLWLSALPHEEALPSKLTKLRVAKLGNVQVPHGGARIYAALRLFDTVTTHDAAARVRIHVTGKHREIL
jgi:hypothetical protein